MAKVSNRNEGPSPAADRQAGRPYAQAPRVDFSEPSERKPAHRQQPGSDAPAGSIASLELTLGF